MQHRCSAEQWALPFWGCGAPVSCHRVLSLLWDGREDVAGLWKTGVWHHLPPLGIVLPHLLLILALSPASIQGSTSCWGCQPVSPAGVGGLQLVGQILVLGPCPRCLGWGLLLGEHTLLLRGSMAELVGYVLSHPHDAAAANGAVEHLTSQCQGGGNLDSGL